MLINTPESFSSGSFRLSATVDQRPGATTSELARLKEPERENRELRTANEILRKASAYFAQAELDRRSKP